jgi:hypothetical protein
VTTDNGAALHQDASRQQQQQQQQARRRRRRRARCPGGPVRPRDPARHRGRHNVCLGEILRRDDDDDDDDHHHKSIGPAAAAAAVLLLLSGVRRCSNCHKNKFEVQVL